jgi:hypothetical protein
MAIVDGVLMTTYKLSEGTPYAWVEHGTCDGCGKHKLVLVSDTSGDQEYGTVQVCKSCIGKMFKNPL